MDPRRFLTLVACGLSLCGCARLNSLVADTTASRAPSAAVGAVGAPVVALFAGPAEVETAAATAVPAAEPETMPAVAPETDSTPTPTPTPYAAYSAEPASPRGLVGPRAIAAANAVARSPSREDGFVGGIRVFAWSPGRVFEIWTAPLRVTMLTLAPGETLVAKAAGDTVRWQIGEAISGIGSAQRTHILLKPFERGLETNLVITTNRRVYLIDLKSGPAETFNAAVAWDPVATDSRLFPLETAVQPSAPVFEPVVMPQGAIDARYRIEPQGRRARWTPTSVFNDGLRTFITFAPDLQVDEAPVLFVIAPDGEAQLVNYRQVGGLFVVDRVFDRAELRLGDRRPQIVRLRRLSGDRP